MTATIQNLSKNLYPKAHSTIADVYRKCGFLISKVTTDQYNVDYEACSFDINGLHVHFRKGKVTPDRPGNFVCLWVKLHGTNVPLDCQSTNIDFLVVDVTSREGLSSGQFVFPKQTLIEKNIISNGLDESNRLKRKKGKLSFRVFPPWASPAESAKKTQEWQNEYFYYLSNNGAEPLNYSRLKSLFHIVS